MIEKDIVWAMLPDGLEEFFQVECYKKTNEFFEITLVEKNIVPHSLPDKYSGKKIINNVIKPLNIVSFPICGRQGRVKLKRRYWKFEGVEEMYRRKIDICSKGTKIDRNFANFLKEITGVGAN